MRKVENQSIRNAPPALFGGAFLCIARATSLDYGANACLLGLLSSYQEIAGINDRPRPVEIQDIKQSSLDLITIDIGKC